MSSIIEKHLKKVADRLIATMEAGTLPWRKTWKTSGGSRGGSPLFTGQAFNALSGKSYSQANTFWLMVSGNSQGFESPRWATFNQWMQLAGFTRYGSHKPLPADLDALFTAAGYGEGTREAGGYSRSWVWPAEVEALKGGATMEEAQALRPKLIEKGTASTMVVGWFRKDAKQRCHETPGGWKLDEHGNPVTRKMWCSRLDSLFNQEQIVCDVRTVEPKKGKAEPVVELPEAEPHEVGEALLKGLADDAGLVVRYGGGRAYYMPGMDTIQNPPIEAFDTVDSFYATVLHEVTHWTGAEHRCNREGIVNFDRFGSERYAFEELVAELGAAMLCQTLGIVLPEVLDDNHAAYLASWVKKLKSEPRAMQDATKQAIESVAWTLKAAGMMTVAEEAQDEEPEPTPEPKAKPTPKPKAKPKARPKAPKKPRKTRKPKAKPEPAPVVVAPTPEPGGQLTLW